jgi:hypothetical protein
MGENMSSIRAEPSRLAWVQADFESECSKSSLPEYSLRGCEISLRQMKYASSRRNSHGRDFRVGLHVCIGPKVFSRPRKPLLP